MNRLCKIGLATFVLLSIVVHKVKMKKLFFIMFISCLMISVFAEIQVIRAGYTTSDNRSSSVAYYWNDKKVMLLHTPDVDAHAKDVASTLKRDGIYNEVTNFYSTYDEVYIVSIDVYENGNINVTVMHGYNNGYNEILYDNYFTSYNLAKTQFDVLCDTYYNKIK